MKAVTGIFISREDARRALENLRAIGVAEKNLALLTPGGSPEAVHDLPTRETEQPGMGKAVGGVVGAALGTAGGAQLGMAAASAFLPGVGPVVAMGLAAAALLGIGGAVGGATAGGALEERLSQGLPKDELFVYEDALRQGRTVVIALAEDDKQAEEAGIVLNHNRAETIDAAREHWWLGLRDAEEEEYRGDEGRDFQRDELDYRRGFEAALRMETRGRSYHEAAAALARHYPDLYRKESFRRGYERGHAHDRSQREKSLHPHS